MKCDTKTMLKWAAGIGALLMAAYFVFPQAQAFILGNWTLLLVLLCPLSMFFMMRSMNTGSKDDDSARRDDRQMKSQAGTPGAAANPRLSSETDADSPSVSDARPRVDR